MCDSIIISSRSCSSFFSTVQRLHDLLLGNLSLHNGSGAVWGHVSNLAFWFLPVCRSWEKNIQYVYKGQPKELKRQPCCHPEALRMINAHLWFLKALNPHTHTHAHILLSFLELSLYIYHDLLSGWAGHWLLTPLTYSARFICVRQVSDPWSSAAHLFDCLDFSLPVETRPSQQGSTKGARGICNYILQLTCFDLYECYR